MQASNWQPRHWLQALGLSRELVFPRVCAVCCRAPCDVLGEPCAACAREMAELPDPRCPACGGALDSVLACCGECLEHGARAWDHAVSVYDFGGLPREIIHRFKYGGQIALAPLLARRMARNWERFGLGMPDAIVPVPLHWLRELSRGYNQAELLARQMGKELQAPVRRQLRRARWTRQQARLPLAERRRNVTAVFVARRRAAGDGQHVLLVDDVMTTGATLGEAAAALKQAGAGRVSVITVARG